MKVKCVRNRLSDLDSPTQQRLQRSIHLEDPLPDLRLGRVYDVIAVRTVDGGLWLMLHTVEDNAYPFPYPVEMFEIIDPHVGPRWVVGISSGSKTAGIHSMGPSEWIQDDTFYEKLLEGDSDARRAYEASRRPD